MGIYDQLSQLSKTPPVKAPEPPKTVEVTPKQDIQVPPTQPANKKPTSSRKDNSQPEENPKLLLDRPATSQRIITRQSFEVFQDQIHVLRQVSLKAKLAGEKLSISEMVREALDRYISDKKLK
jgi:hypothetical protein